MLKIAERKPRRARWVAPASRAVISHRVPDSILKRQLYRQCFLLPNQNIRGGFFTFLQGWLAKGFLELHMLLLCLAFMPY